MGTVVTRPASWRTVKGKIKDKDGGETEYTGNVTVHNVAPTVGDITAPTDPVEVGMPISASANFSDPGTADAHNAEWDWGDDAITTQEDITSPAAASHTYAEAGVCTVKLTVTDDDADVGESFYRYVVVYDPDGGFVTGGGWIDSPDLGWRRPTLRSRVAAITSTE